MQISTSKQKKLAEDYEKFCEKIRNSTPVTIDETEVEKQARIKRLTNNPAEFQAYYFPQMRKTPKYLVKAVTKLLKEPQYFAWWQMFRGAGKSTWSTLINPMMLMARGEMKFCLLIGPNEEFSTRFMSNLQAQLENNQRFIHDFGAQVKYGSWKSGEFTTMSGVTFIGLGMGQPVRGLNIGQNRPDYIVCSDLESKELSKNPSRCREMYNWIMEDVLGTFAVGAKYRRFLFDNNYFSKISIGHLLKSENPSIDITTVNILDSKGNPIEDFITPEFVESVRKNGYRAFMREYMNTPIEEGAIFKADWIRWKKPLKLQEYDYLVTYCDPAFKGKKANDYCAIVLMGKKGREYHILKAFCRQCSIGVMIQWHYNLAEELRKKKAIAYHIVEASFSQDVILENEYNDEGERRGWYMDIIKDKSGKGNKVERIEAVSVKWENGHVYYNEEERGDPDMQTGIDQTLAFEKGSKSHDDFPDCTEGGIAWLEVRSVDSWGKGAWFPKHGKAKKTMNY